MLKRRRTTTESRLRVSTITLFLLPFNATNYPYHMIKLSMKSSCRPWPSSPGRTYAIGRATNAVSRKPQTPSIPTTIVAGASIPCSRCSSVGHVGQQKVPITVWRAWMPCATNTRTMPRIFRPMEVVSPELESELKILLCVTRNTEPYAIPTRTRERKITTRDHHSALFSGFFNQYWRIRPVKIIMEPRIICQIETGIHNRPTNMMKEARKSQKAGAKTL